MVSKKDVKLAVCKTCNVEISRGGNQQRQFNTTNLIRHLRTRHTTEYGEYEKQARAKQIPKTPVTQLTVSETFRRLEPYSRDSERSGDITTKLMEFIGLDDILFYLLLLTGYVMFTQIKS